MQLCSVEHKLNTSSTFFSSKLDSPSPMFWLEENLILSNVLITGESNFDEKNVKEVFNMCSTEQSCIHIGITCYKIGTLELLKCFDLVWCQGQRHLALTCRITILNLCAFLGRSGLFNTISRSSSRVPLVVSKNRKLALSLLFVKLI